MRSHVPLANPDVCQTLHRPFLFLPQHPIHFLFKKFYTSISPIGGHDGFDQPAGGSFIHYLVRSHYLLCAALLRL